MSNSKTEANKAAFRLLIEDAMPNGNFDVIRSLVSRECVTERAGFANLYNAIGDAIPERGNFLEWIEKGWKPLSEALNGQKVTIREVAGDGNTVMMMWDYEVQHIGTFAGAPATNKTLYWQEVGMAHFNDEGKIEKMWFMCEELKLATQIGYKLELE
ncbi:ester cyclase [Superficieibacter sp. 1612_C1]|uniref:ester cyclase n=1 Tax=Superficieibacter sp. 1612_C1 TaxID=2780382 RepID=UPI0018831209|nr:ester cyclase [Superficieibacter sp. 1612_C1]